MREKGHTKKHNIHALSESDFTGGNMPSRDNDVKIGVDSDGIQDVEVEEIERSLFVPRLKQRQRDQPYYGKGKRMREVFSH